MTAIENSTTTLAKPQKFARYRSVRRAGSRDLSVDTVKGGPSPPSVPASSATSDSTIKRLPSRYRRPGRITTDEKPLMPVSPTLSSTATTPFPSVYAVYQNIQPTPQTSSPLSPTSCQSSHAWEGRMRTGESAHARVSSLEAAREEALRILSGDEDSSVEAKQKTGSIAGRTRHGNEPSSRTRHAHSNSLSRYHASATVPPAVHPIGHPTPLNTLQNQPSPTDVKSPRFPPTSYNSRFGRAGQVPARSNSQCSGTAKPLVDLTADSNNNPLRSRTNSIQQSRHGPRFSTSSGGPSGYIHQPLLTDIHNPEAAFTDGSLLASTHKSVDRESLNSLTEQAFVAVPSSLLATSARTRSRAGSTFDHGHGVVGEAGKPLVDIQFQSEFTNGSLLSRVESMKVSAPKIDRHKYVEGIVKVGEGYD